MIINENFDILDEDEDIMVEKDEILDEGIIEESEADEVLDEGIVGEDEEDEILEEGIIALSEDEDTSMEVFNETIIKAASNVDTNASAKSIEKVKAKINKQIESGKYRAYKSSDKPLLDKTIKSKGLLKQAVGAMVGGALGTAAGGAAGTAVGGAINAKNKKIKSTRLPDKSAGRAALPMKEDFDAYVEENGITTSLCEEAVAEAISMYIDTLTEDILNEKLAKSVKVGAAAGAGTGAVAGAAAGRAIAKKVASNMKYSVFTLNGLTILAIYSASKDDAGKGKSKCYAVTVKADGSKVALHPINLKAK